MNKIKYIIGILIVIVGMLCLNLLNREYFQKEDKRNINAQYLALDAETALKNITIKKEMIEPKEYYTAGDEIKYKFTVTNNNSETVKVNVLDNISNLERNQSNLVIESAKCNEKDVTVSANELNIKEIEIASKGTYTCTIDAYTKKTYPEGKVKSNVKVYIDDEDEYNEDSFTYQVRDSILEIEQSINKYILYYKEQAEYKVVIKNISKEIASGPVEINIYLPEYYKVLNLNSNFYTISSSGATTNLVNSNFKASCKTNENKTCNITEVQNISFKNFGINPGETIILSFKFNTITQQSLTTTNSVNVKINEYDKEKIIKSTYQKFPLTFVTGKIMDDLQGEIYFTDNNNNILNDFYDLDYVNGWSSIILNNNFYRTAADIYVLDDEYAETQVNEIKSLPAGMEYDVGKNATITGCASGSDVQYSINGDKKYDLISSCKMKNSNNIYYGNIKVPIKITNVLLNKQICIIGDNQALMYGERNDQTNVYCMGPNLEFNKSSKVLQAGKDLDIYLKVNNYGNGRAGNVKLTYNYDAGLEIDVSSLTDAVIDKKNRIITWTIPLIRPGETVEVNVKAKNTTNLTNLTLSGNLEGTKYEEKVAIAESDTKYLKGDWNLNGTVNINDAIYARKYIARLGDVVLPPAQVYDLNGDNNPTISDLVLLRKLISEGKN